MKFRTFGTACALFILLFTACQKEPFFLGFDKNSLTKTIESDNTASSTPPQYMAFDSLAAQQTETYTLDVSQKIAHVTTRKGVKLTVNPDDLRFKNGATIGNLPIKLLIKQAHKPSEMIVFDKPTNTEGGFLESYGEFYVAAFANNQPLELRQNASIRIETPVFGKNVPRLMPVWDADTTLKMALDGLNHQAEKTRADYPFIAAQGSMWRRDSSTKARLNADNKLEFELTKLDTWKNCDIFYADTGRKTTVLVLFNQHHTPSVTPNEFSAVYFKPDNRNTLIKFSNPILNAPQHKQGFHSYEQMMPIGMKGKLLAFTRKNNRFYSCLKDITIQPNTLKAAFYDMRLTEVTPDAFIRTIKLLDE